VVEGRLGRARLEKCIGMIAKRYFSDYVLATSVGASASRGSFATNPVVVRDFRALVSLFVVVSDSSFDFFYDTSRSIRG